MKFLRITSSAAPLDFNATTAVAYDQLGDNMLLSRSANAMSNRLRMSASVTKAVR